MRLEELVYSTLVVSASEKLNLALVRSLPSPKYDPVRVVTSVSAARRELLSRKFDLVILNSPLPDECGTRFAIDLCNDASVGVLMLVKAEDFEGICDEVSKFGVLTLAKPTSPSLLGQSLSLLCATRERIRRMEKKAATVEDKMEEIRLVNRAKWILIEELKMTEADAHRYIEKQAMDRCVTRREIAESIIQTYK